MTRLFERNIPVDASEVVPGLWVGGKVDPELSYPRWKVVVLCSDRHQPKMRRFKGLLVRAPFEDTIWPTPQEQRIIVQAARTVAMSRRMRRVVLVTCYAGLNRSALVTALAMKELGKFGDSEDIIARIRAARGEGALCNREFEKMIWNYTPESP